MAANDLAARITAEFLGKPFGIVRFWRFAVVRPNDQSYVLSAAHADGDRLELRLRHEFLAGADQTIEVWAPRGLGKPASDLDVGMVIVDAERLRWNAAEAWRDGAVYWIRTSRGEGSFDILDAPALTLAR